MRCPKNVREFFEVLLKTLQIIRFFVKLMSRCQEGRTVFGPPAL